MTKRNPLLNIIKDILHLGLETFGRYYSTYRGFVFSNEDPQGLQRVQLIIPEVGGNNPYAYWAIPKGVFSGTGYGSQIIPQKGELVWVEFERGHPEVPIYTLGYFGVGEMPNDPELADTNCYWFKTPYGHLIKINDTKKYITITTNGAEITINPQGLISLKNKDMDIGTLLTNILTTYIKTTTILGETLSPDSIKDAVDNVKQVKQLFI